MSVRTGHRRIGYALAAVGLAAAMVSGVASLVVAGQIGASDQAAAASNLAWSFGVNTAAFGTIKLDIATVLAGILVRLWIRVESVRDSLPGLRPLGEPGKVIRDPVAVDYTWLDCRQSFIRGTGGHVGPHCVCDTWHRCGRAFDREPGGLPIGDTFDIVVDAFKPEGAELARGSRRHISQAVVTVGHYRLCFRQDAG